jgi:hypothetical protein
MRRESVIMTVGITSRSGAFGWLAYSTQSAQRCAEHPEKEEIALCAVIRGTTVLPDVLRRPQAIFQFSLRALRISAHFALKASRQPHRPRQFHHGMKRRRAGVPSKGNGDRKARSNWPAHRRRVIYKSLRPAIARSSCAPWHQRRPGRTAWSACPCRHRGNHLGRWHSQHIP